MHPALLILLPVILAIFLAGGISIKSPGGESYGQPVTVSEGALAGVFNALQIKNLIPNQDQTIPTQTPSVGGTTPTTPPGITFTPAPTNPPRLSPTRSPTLPGTNACTTNLECIGGCSSSGIQTCTARGPQPCTPTTVVQSCILPTRPPIRCGTPTDQCVLYTSNCPCVNKVAQLIICENGSCVGEIIGGVRRNSCSYGAQGFCRSCQKYTGDGTYCYGKPVIYLYPTKITSVDVSVETTGQIIVSDPHYPSGGWKGVVAHPDGTLYYQGKRYRELFYETSVSSLNPPESGIVIKTSDLEEQLTMIITKLGLIKSEQAEFLDWWLPRLKDLNSAYILFSILDDSEKVRTDRVSILPKPDTMIEFIAYFKPLSKPISVSPLILPPTPPERIGFTAVEWGGVIDDK